MRANIHLETIAESAFNNFLETILPLYIEERSAADQMSKTVVKQFAHYAKLLPHGYPGHYIARIIDEVTNLAVGTMWFRLDASSGEAYIYYITVRPEHHRRGYASAAINAAAHLAHSISLHMNKPL